MELAAIHSDSRGCLVFVICRGSNPVEHEHKHTLTSLLVPPVLKKCSYICISFDRRVFLHPL